MKEEQPTNLSEAQTFEISELWCDETINANMILSKFQLLSKEFYEEEEPPIAAKIEILPEEEKEPDSNKNRAYKTYSNMQKISFFELASQIGFKKAAEKLSVVWSTAKAWIKKDEAFKSKKTTFVDVLKSRCRRLICVRTREKEETWSG